ncbi:MAG: anti-sigma factor [Actinomycetota bacterium]|jgi:anti-sigma factor RsiW|nr:zf-HC2 domain-containing protein [Euzebyaceae bacterium]MDQ3452424.1 anti-sigma factor [Actinomycetota bacterium]
MADGCDAFEPLGSAWVDGELRHDERANMAAHLQGCPRCRSRITGLRITSTMLRSVPQRQVPMELGGVRTDATPVPVAADASGLPRALARSLAGMAAAVALLGVAAFAAGAPDTDARTVAVPVDVYVADHIVHSIGGPVSTPALLSAQP